MYQSRDALIQPLSLLYTGSSTSTRGIYWSDTHKICVIGIIFLFKLTWGRTSLSHKKTVAARHHLMNVAGSRRHGQRNVFRAGSLSNLIRVQMRGRTFFMIDNKSTMKEHEMNVCLTKRRLYKCLLSSKDALSHKWKFSRLLLNLMLIENQVKVS